MTQLEDIQPPQILQDGLYLATQTMAPVWLTQQVPAVEIRHIIICRRFWQYILFLRLQAYFRHEIKRLYLKDSGY
jgi:hypothetical protein